MTMQNRKKVLAICGSTRAESVNLHILKRIAEMYEKEINFSIFTQIDQIPHFNPDLDTDTPPEAVSNFRKQIEEADGILICTPEYVFSLPGSFKNAIEWLVSTILLTDKPAALITASSSGQKAHEALNLVMKTVGVKLADAASLLISAPKTKISIDGQITDEATLKSIQQLMEAFIGTMSAN
jgi:NAD(P)H-dependent FMN reductase